MKYYLWENDKEEGQAVIYGTSNAIDFSTFKADKLSINQKHIVLHLNEKSQGIIPDNVTVIGGPRVFSERLVNHLHSIGVDNFDCIQCKIVNDLTEEVFENYFAINFVGKIECINFEESEVEFLDNNHTKLLGYVYLTLDEEKIRDLKLFALKEFPVQLVAREDVVESILDIGFTGIRFVEQGNPKDRLPPIDF